MDVIDRANQEQEYILSSQLALSKKKEHRLTPRGTCYYCEDTVKSNMLFCDSLCLKDYDREELIKKRTGRNE